jgi:hypothetical protein
MLKFNITAHKLKVGDVYVDVWAKRYRHHFSKSIKYKNFLTVGSDHSYTINQASSTYTSLADLSLFSRLYASQWESIIVIVLALNKGE